MLEGFSPSHPSSWTAQDLVEAGTPYHPIISAATITATANLSPQYIPIERQEQGEEKERKETTENLSISLDFLQGEEEEEEEEELQRGRPGPRQIRAFPHLSHLSAKPINGSSFSSDSPETESPPGSEQEWRRSLAAQGDPIYKTGHRSNSRDPPGFPTQRISHFSSNGSKPQYNFGVSPPFESSSPSSLSSFGGRIDTDSNHLYRSLSATRSTSQQGNNTQNKWSTSGSTLRQSHDNQQAPTASDATHLALNSKIKEANPNILRSFSNDHTQQYPSIHRSFTTLDYINNGAVSSSSPDRTNRPAIQTPMSGLPTMHEEGDNLSSLMSRSSVATNDPNRLPRHRSTSSAAALQHDDRTSLFHRDTNNGPDSFQRSVSLWRGELGGMSPDTYARAAATTNQQQGGIDQQSYQFQSMSPPMNYPSPVSASSSRWGADRGRRNDYASAPSFDAFPEEEVSAAVSTSDANNPSAQRRAIGFEVSRPISGTSRTSSVGRQSSTPRAGDTLSNRMFNNGAGLAITDEDLGTDFQNLRLNLDDVASQPRHQQQHHQYAQEEERRRMNMRVPSSNAAMSGVHAASVPSGFGGGNHTFANFGQSPPIGSNNSRFGGGGVGGGQWPASARLRSDEDNASSNWSDLIPSPSNRSNFTESSQGYHHQQAAPSQQSHSTNTRSEVQLEDQQRKYGLSASAKVFQGGNSFAERARSPPSIPQHSFISSQRAARDLGNPDYAIATQQGSSFASSHVQRSGTSPHRQSSTEALSEGAIASLVTLGPLAPASGSGGPGDSGPGGSLQELGKGVPLQMLPRSTTLFIVEFKEGRTDLYFRQLQSGSSNTDEIQQGDLVIVEADRGKDLGTVVNDSITVNQVQTFLAQQSELLAQQASAAAASSSPDPTGGNVSGDSAPHPAAISLSRLSRSMNPKRLFAKAGPADTSLLHSKAQDEERALTLCTTKVNQRGLPMTVVAAELQWDRRKLTFYYTATQRVDFRDLVKELFRLYKTRIWMCHLSHPSGTGLP